MNKKIETKKTIRGFTVTCDLKIILIKKIINIFCCIVSLKSLVMK